MVEPYQPINTLKPIVDEIWIVNGPVIAFRHLGLRLPFPTRMTIVNYGSDLAVATAPRCPKSATSGAIDGIVAGSVALTVASFIS